MNKLKTRYTHEQTKNETHRHEQTKNEIHEQTNAGHIFNLQSLEFPQTPELIVRVICAGKGT